MIQCHIHGTHLATTTWDETQQEGRDHKPKPAPRLTGEEVCSQQDVAMETDELSPRYGLFALRGRWDAVTFQDVAHRLGANRIAQVRQRTHDAVIPPRAILAGHPHHQVFDRSTNARTANRRLGLGTITLLVRKHAVPSQDGVGLGNCRHFFQGLLAQLLAQLGERFAVAVRELDAPSDLLAEDAILGDQVRIVQPELFLNRRGD
jgi:hypothetical protein